MKKNEFVAEVADGIGCVIGVILFLVGYAKIADPTQYSLLAQTPAWLVVIMIVAIVFCLLADCLTRPRTKKALRRMQDPRKIKQDWRNVYYGSR